MRFIMFPFSRSVGFIRGSWDEAMARLERASILNVEDWLQTGLLRREVCEDSEALLWENV